MSFSRSLFVMYVIFGVSTSGSFAFADCASDGERAINEGKWVEAENILKPCAEAQNPEAQSLLGGLYALPQSGLEDPDLALRWTEAAATQGSWLALSNLAYYYEKGLLGLQADTDRSIALHEAAIKAGSEASKYRLAQLFVFGIGVSADEKAAIALLETRQGEKVGDAHFQVGGMFKNGYDGSGEGSSIDRARLYYEQSARLGHRGAQFFLSELLLDMEEKEMRDEAYLWMAVAALNQHPQALELWHKIEAGADPKIFSELKNAAATCISSQYKNC
ncbi:hypothetical protein HYN69_04665 [Gemmobacter aquarius]|uniref:TPR repeat n=1 Tax=Paragemmobacter aquarius TaxID=2169400 RepID=A0A2S0UJ88_9RHOB|nr:tetratricopeptide repeat protein [Gemmobacter aquarius]AWB47897.1 hypothetical protein HYN69_04665 [Gemmobacter aquarius]